MTPLLQQLAADFAALGTSTDGFHSSDSIDFVFVGRSDSDNSCWYRLKPNPQGGQAIRESINADWLTGKIARVDVVMSGGQQPGKKLDITVKHSRGTTVVRSGETSNFSKGVLRALVTLSPEAFASDQTIGVALPPPDSQSPNKGKIVFGQAKVDGQTFTDKGSITDEHCQAMIAQLMEMLGQTEAVAMYRETGLTRQPKQQGGYQNGGQQGYQNGGYQGGQQGYQGGYPQGGQNGGYPAQQQGYQPPSQDYSGGYPQGGQQGYQAPSMPPQAPAAQ